MGTEPTQRSLFTVKTYVALGSHEILVKARDSYGAQTGQEPLFIQLEAPDEASAAEEAENTLTFVALGGLGNPSNHWRRNLCNAWL